jgi:hypothetical protein
VCDLSMRENREVPWSSAGVYWPPCPDGCGVGRIGRPTGRGGNAEAVRP